MNCSVVIPVYNSEKSLTQLVERLEKALPVFSQEYEIVLVNDGSRDGSWEAIQQLAENHPRLHGINLMRNYGQHNALLCGVRAARYEVTVTMDDDLQHPPEEIHRLVEKMAEGNDVVYAVPKKLPHSAWRNFFSKLSKRLIARVMGVPSVREIGSFRAFKTNLREAFSAYQSYHVILDVLLTWGTARFGVVDVDEAPRPYGHSNYNLFMLIKHAIVVLTGFSTVPLRFASLLGFVMVLFGILILAYVLIVYFIAGSIPGFPFLASIIALFSGAQLFTLGIFGEYLAHIFERSMDRPTYMVRETTRSPKNCA